MRGHQALIAMRMAGKKPDAVNITVGTDPSESWKSWRGANPWSEIAQIEIPERDRLNSLPPELRCVVGLVVQVDGSDRDRTEAVAQMALEAGAKRVFVTTHNEGGGIRAAAFITEEMQEWRSF